MRIPAAIFAVALAVAGHTAERAPAGSTHAVGVPLPSAHVHNLFRATTNVFSGSSPDGEAGFAEIARLGVKTLISVDGSKPDVQAARRHGLRTIHLPFGYDGVPSNRVAELAKAAQVADGPIYVHCHHGLHRGPAAVAVICEATAGWTTNQAVSWLRQAGTAPDYHGLYSSALEFRMPGSAALARVVELSETVRTSSLVEAMVAIDEELGQLKAAQKTAWSGSPNQPDLTPAYTATLLWEQLRELGRDGDTAKRPAGFRAKLADSEQAADRLRALLRDGKSDHATRDAAFLAVSQACAACHHQYRN